MIHNPILCAEQSRQRRAQKKSHSKSNPDNLVVRYLVTDVAIFITNYEKYMEGKHSTSSRYAVSYFKGLGSCGKDSWDYMINKNPNFIQIVSPNPDEATEKLKLAFSDQSDPRKLWLMS